jgi:hypothetical protein
MEDVVKHKNSGTFPVHTYTSLLNKALRSYIPFYEKPTNGGGF